MALTPKQRKLRSEIEAIASSISIDHWNIEQYDPEMRTMFLDLAKDQLVRGNVIIKYTLLDELLTDIICNYYFRRPKKTTSYRKLWRTKRFQVFVHYLMDETFLLKKLTVVQALHKVPRDVSTAIARINDVRNALAHSFFPENRRRYKAMMKVMYNGLALFTPDGIEEFENDFDLAHTSLLKLAFGV
jgi:hypothetical protein